MRRKKRVTLKARAGSTKKREAETSASRLLFETSSPNEQTKLPKGLTTSFPSCPTKRNELFSHRISFFNQHCVSEVGDKQNQRIYLWVTEGTMGITRRRRITERRKRWFLRDVAAGEQQRDVAENYHFGFGFPLFSWINQSLCFSGWSKKTAACG